MDVKLKLKQYSDAKLCLKNLTRKGAKQALMSVEDGNYLISCNATPDIIATARSGLRYTECEIALIVAMFVSGVEIKEIAIKNLRLESAIRSKLTELNLLPLSFPEFDYSTDLVFETNLLGNQDYYENREPHPVTLIREYETQEFSALNAIKSLFNTGKAEISPYEHPGLFSEPLIEEHDDNIDSSEYLTITLLDLDKEGLKRYALTASRCLTSEDEYFLDFICSLVDSNEVIFIKLKYAIYNENFNMAKDLLVQNYGLKNLNFNINLAIDYLEGVKEDFVVDCDGYLSAMLCYEPQIVAVVDCSYAELEKFIAGLESRTKIKTAQAFPAQMSGIVIQKDDGKYERIDFPYKLHLVSDDRKRLSTSSEFTLIWANKYLFDLFIRDLSHKHTSIVDESEFNDIVGNKDGGTFSWRYD